MKNVEHNFQHNLRVDTQKHNAQTFQHNLSDHTLSYRKKSKKQQTVTVFTCLNNLVPHVVRQFHSLFGSFIQ